MSDDSAERPDSPEAEAVRADSPEAGVASNVDASGGVTGDGGAREVEVPMELYKTVTVFATLIAMVAVIAGFVVLDAATNSAQAPVDEVNVVLALAGLGSILFGAFVYAFSTRFRTPGMGKSKDESDEGSGNG